MKRSPIFVSLLGVFGLGLTLTLLWMLNSGLPIVRAASITINPINVGDSVEPHSQTSQENGQFIVSAFLNGAWQTVGALSYGQDLTDKQLDLSSLDLSDQVSLRVFYGGDTAAHIDAVQFGGTAPSAVSGASEEASLVLKKLASRDYDVIDAAHGALTFTFDVGTGAPAILVLTARIEPERIVQTPFQFPLENLYRPMNTSSSFYTYIFDSRPCQLTVDGDLNSENLGEPFFKEFSKTGTGHPSNYTYGWVCNDADNVYVAIDFLPDNTMDGDKDYAKVYVKTSGGLREFKVSVPEQDWGKPGFTYAPRALYQHKVYEFKLPLTELGLAQVQPGTNVEMAFAAYGTAAPPSNCFATLNGSTVYNSATAVQQAIDNANDGDTVKLAGHCAGVQLRDGSYQTAYVSKTLTVQGGYTTTNWTTPDPLANPTTLDAQNSGRVFNITAGDVAISDLTIQNGNATGDGGGIYASGNLTLTNVNVFSNAATADGGGVDVRGNAILINSLFQNNQCANYGGGLYVRYDLTLANTQFISNTTGGIGGGAHVTGAATVIGGRFENNQCTNPDCWGGGFYANTTLALTGTHFLGNTAVGDGGALYLGNGTRSRLVNALFARNTASGNGAAMYLLAPLGSGGSAEIIHTTIASPTVGAGQAIYVGHSAATVNITNTIITSYTTGIQEAGGTVSEDYNLFFGNTVTGTGVIAHGIHSLTGYNPAFVNPAGDDYHLTSTSAAINTGADAGVYTDFENETRPQAGGFDIGYDESAYVTPVDLAVGKNASSPAIAGDGLYYTVTLTNTFPGAASVITLTDYLPFSSTLTVMDQTDDYSDTLGFGGHTALTNTQVNLPRGGGYWAWVDLEDTNALSGTFTSRAIDASHTASWSSLGWTPERPYWKELPNNRGVETAYDLGNTNMTSNRLLLHLNGNITDTSGLYRPITCPAVVGEACPSTYNTGRFNQALAFDGSMSNTVAISDTASPVRYALEAWVYPTVITDTSFILRTDVLSGTTYHYSHLLGISGDRFLHYLNDGTGRAITSTTTIQTGQWYHLVGTAASNGEMKLYVNGVEEASLGGLGTVWAGGDQYRLGSAYGSAGSSQYFTGRLDEVAVYSRTLSAGEVLDHYLRGALRLSFQVRSCADAACTGQAFTSTVYSEQNNASLGLPTAALTDIPDNRYLQYQARFETDSPAYNLRLYRVQVGPAHPQIEISQGDCQDPVVSSIITCTLDSLAGNAVVTLTTRLNLNPSLLGVITNTAIVTTTSNDVKLDNNTAIVTSTVTAQADLSIGKYDEQDPVNVGSVITYHLDVYNGGPSTALSVTVTDTLSSGLIGYVASHAASWTCQQPGNTITCTLPVLFPGQWSSIHITTTAPGVQGTVTNTAGITSTLTSDDPNPNNNDAQDTTTITFLANLAIAKSGNPSPVRPGFPVTFTVTVTNTGPYTATSIIVTDTIQAGTLTGTVVSAGGWTCGSPGSILTCTKGTLGPNLSASFALTVTGPLTGFISNRADVTSIILDLDDTNNTAYGYATVLPVADLNLAKSGSPNPVYAGQTLSYTLVFTNSGPAPAGSITHTLAFQNPHRIHIDGNAAWPYPTSINVANAIGQIRNVTVTLNGLDHSFAADVSALLVGPGGQTVMLMSNAGGGTTISNSVVSFSDAATMTLPLSGTITSNTYRPTSYGFSGPQGNFTAPAPAGPYGSSLSAFNGGNPNGQWQLYVYDTFSASDNGHILNGWNLYLTTATTDTVTLTDNLPPGMTLGSITAPTGWTCQPGGVVTCVAPHFGVNIPASVLIAATAPITSGVITNTAFITSTTADFGPALNTAQITTTVLGFADLSISKSASPEPVGAGQPLTYTLTFTNAGPSPVASATVTDALPNGASVFSAPGCTNVGNVLTCTVASLGVNIPTNLTIVALAPPNAGVITNTAGITATAIDTHTLNNTAWVTTTVTPIADLGITKSDAPDPVDPDKTITYTVVVSNNGPSAAVTGRLTDSLPISATFVSLSAPGWTCTPPPVGSTGNIVCTIPNLAAGSPYTLIIAARVDAGARPGVVLTNTARVSSNTPDPTTPNLATTTTTVGNYRIYLPVVMRDYAFAPDLVVQSVSVSSGQAQIVIKNQGDAPVTQVITQEFWVDLYINPSSPPTRVNQTRETLGCQGAVWGVTGAALSRLTPGGVLTLTLNDAYYWPSKSNMPPSLPPGTPIYAQVDSANVNTTYGAVLENHEITGGAYNNILGPVSSTSTMGNVSLETIPLSVLPADRLGNLPVRP